MNERWVLGFVGAGVMAETMIAGVLRDGQFGAERILASDANQTRRLDVSARHGVTVVADNQEVVEQADLLVLAIKPQTLSDVLGELRGAIRPETQVLSIVAGATITSLRQGLEHHAVARAMPNLPCRVHQGMTVWTGAEGDAAERIRQVLEGMGTQVRVEHEVDVDRATAVNGTGPAIVAEFVKAMMEAATYLGQPRELARQTVLSTVLGTAALIGESESHVAQIIDEVTSPGGTTSRALQVLKQGRFSAVVTEAVDAAYQRTIELGRLQEERLRRNG